MKRFFRCLPGEEQQPTPRKTRSSTSRVCRPTLEPLEDRLAPADLGFAFALGSHQEEEGYAVTTDADGNAYVTGRMRGSPVDFDPGPGVTILDRTNTSNDNMFVAKYAPNGQLVWASSADTDPDQLGIQPPPGVSPSVGTAIALGPGGSVYVTGGGNSGFNGYVAKFNGSGALIWAVNMGGGTGQLGFNSIAVDASGNSWVTGNYSGTKDLDPGPGEAIVTTLPNNGSGAVAVKLDASGNLLWHGAMNPRSGARTVNVASNGIALDATGNAYLTGSFSGPVDLDPGAGSFPVTSLAGEFFSDAFVLKLNSSGELLWADTMGGSGFGTSALGRAITVDAAGNSYVTGEFNNLVDFDPGPGVHEPRGNSNHFILKLDAAGAFQYVRAPGVHASFHTHGYAIALDQVGNVWMSGTVSGTATVNGTTLSSAGERDVLVWQQTTDGAFVWAGAMGAPRNDFGYGIAVSRLGDVWITGRLEGTQPADFDPGPGTFPLSGNGTIDIFVAKLADNRAPTDITLAGSQVAENQPMGTTISAFSTVDPDGGDTFTYTLVGGTGSDDNASFTIGTGGELKTAASFDHETRTTYTIRVRSTDAGGLFTEKNFIVGVTNVNEAPTNVVLSNAGVAENQPTGTTIGAFSTVDPDGGDTFAYALVGGTGGADNASFTIDASGNLRTAASFDFEAKSSYSIRVRGTDAGGLFVEKVFNVGVTNVNEAPTLTVPGSQTAFEDVDHGISGIRVGDPEGDALTVTLAVGHGTLTLATTTGLTVTGNGSGSISLFGSVASLNAVLATLVYRGSLNYSGGDTLSLTAGDGSLGTSSGVAVAVKSAAQQAADLETQVNALVVSGVLTGGQGEALNLNLRENKGDAGKVQSFINQVWAFLNAGILTQAQADALLGPGTILLASVSRR